MITCEILSEKIKLARQTFSEAGISDHVKLLEGDALEQIKGIGNIAFCFIDCMNTS